MPRLALTAALDDPETGLLIFDPKLRLLHATSQIPFLLGLRAETPMDSLDVLQLLSRSDLDAASIALAKSGVAESTGRAQAEPIILLSRDRSRRIRMRVRSVGRGYRVASFNTICGTELMTNQGAGFANFCDPVTGLASRPCFERAVTAHLAEAPQAPVSMLVLNLSRFKAANDALGHAAGDTLLRQVAERISSVVRNDGLTARLDGDEFAVLICRSPTMNEPSEMATRILEMVQRAYLVEGKVANVGAMIGIARYPGDGTDCTSLLRRADLALCQSRRSGHSSFRFFDPHMEVNAEADRDNELRRAQVLRQLEVFYQPQVDTAANRLIGFEALLRWRHPERGLIPPGDFLPLAEKTGAIVSIGDWVLRTACREAMTWPGDLVVAVNASPVQFDTGRFADSVRRDLRVTGLPGERLEIEITEGLLLRHDEANLRTLYDLRSMKVRIVMDDFGTGYASLGQFARFPFDKIKIDRSLAVSAGKNIKQKAIVRAITALGDTLGIRIMGEGVENTEQLERLKEDGCTQVQGFLFGAPVEASKLPEIISLWRSRS